jgi:hypothetical protein
MLILLLLATMVMVTGLSAGPGQQGDPGKLFPETGHQVTGEFLAFWNSAPEPETLFGYPITDMTDHNQKQGVKVQYFQRARMEYDPSLPKGQQVQLAPLGEWFYSVEAGQPADFPTANGACRTIQDPAGKDRAVCYAFLQFYDRHQGDKYLGLPISNAEWLEGRLVQYFQRARMEWHPERPAGQRVTLTDLGKLDFDISNGNIEETTVSGSIGVVPFDIEMYAFADRPLLASGQQQRIYIIVRDQYKKPLKGIQVNLTVQYPDGQVARVSSKDPTNDDGVAQASFAVENVQPNQIINVLVETVPNDLVKITGSATTWFRIWW